MVAINQGLVSSTPLRTPATQDTSVARASKSIAQTILNGTPATATVNVKGRTFDLAQAAKSASPPPTNLPRGSIIDELV